MSRKNRTFWALAPAGSENAGARDEWFEGAIAFGSGKPGRETGEVADVANFASVLPWGRDEAAFVTDLQAGSEAAFDLLVAHYHAPVFGLAYGMLGDPADAADCAQEVFLKAFRGIRGFRRGSSLKTWLYRIAVREALNQRRWWRRHLRQQISIDAELDERPLARALEDEKESPFEWMAAREIQQLVRRALVAVPEVFRSAVILRDLEGMAYEEIAEVLDVSVGTVKSRILRGRRALREILEPLLADAPARHTPEARAHELRSSYESSAGFFADPREELAGGGGE